MNSAARPRNDTTKLRALATGLRLMTTAAPKISVNNEKIQNRNGGMERGSEFRFQMEENVARPIPEPCSLNSETFAHFFLFHFSTTPCITPPISSSFSL